MSNYEKIKKMGIDEMAIAFCRPFYSCYDCMFESLCEGDNEAMKKWLLSSEESARKWFEIEENKKLKKVYGD